MERLYHQISQETAEIVTKKYSTSFSLATKLLASDIRSHIYNIYGFVRLADEIVDSFHQYPKAELLDKFESDFYLALKNKISLNPIINAFQQTYHQFNIDIELVDAFLASMRTDLEKKEYKTAAEIETYIYGSADVVGLMCLKIFVYGDEEKYQELKPSAMRLGSAFQKINFLRDLQNDYQEMGRSYFVSLDLNQISPQEKTDIVDDIRADLAVALEGIKKLPKSSRKGVYIAYRYYNRLLKKLDKTSTEVLLSKRVRINNFFKMYLLLKSMIRTQLNIL